MREFIDNYRSYKVSEKLYKDLKAKEQPANNANYIQDEARVKSIAAPKSIVKADYL